MTENSNKVRALILSALMVFSVFAGTVAFAGTAAAATNQSISPADDGVGAPTTYTASGEVELTSDNSMQHLTLDLEGADFSNVGSGDLTLFIDGTEYTGGWGTVESPSDGVLSIEMSNSQTVTDGDSVTLKVADVQNPDSGGTYDASLGLEGTTEGDTFETISDTYDIAGGDGEAPTLRKATHYVDSTDDEVIELAFDESIDEAPSEVTVGFDDGSTMDLSVIGSGTGDARVLLDTGGTVYDGVRNVTIDEGDFEDAASNAVAADDYSVTYAPQTVDIGSADDNDPSFTIEADAYVGTNVALETDSDETPISIEGPSVSTSRSTGSGSQVYVYDTDDLETGTYNFTADSTEYNLDLENLGLTVESDESSFEAENEDVTATVEANDFDRPVEGVVLDSDDDVVAAAEGTLSADGNAVLNFGTIEDPGNYTIEVTDVNSGVTASDDVEITEIQEGDTSFSQGTTTVTQGDNAEFTVELSGGVTEATVLIGDLAEDGYQANVSVTDGDEDGEVTFDFNTYTAGAANNNIEVVSLAGDSEGTDDEVSLNNQGEDAQTLSDILDTGDYIVSVGTGNATETAENPDAVGTLVVEQREAPSQQLWRTSDGTLEAVNDAIGDEDVDEVGAITSAVENDQVTQTDTVAIDPDGSMDDVLVHQVTAPGLEGILDFVSDDSDSTTEALYKATQAETIAYEDPLLDITFEETNPGSNTQAATLDVSELTANEATSALTVVYDDNSSSYYVFVDTAALEDEGFEDGDNVETQVNVQAPRLLDIEDDATADEAEDEYQTAAANFSVEEATGSFDLNADDEIEAVAGNASITGTTNVAPGTEFTVRVQSTEDTQPRFFEPVDVVVSSNGTFTATLDLSQQSPGDTFSASVSQAAFSASADGVLVEETTPTATATATATEQPETETATATEAPETDTEAPDTETEAPDTDTEEPETDTTTTTTPGFGVAVALVALLAAALLAGRRE